MIRVLQKLLWDTLPADAGQPIIIEEDASSFSTSRRSHRGIQYEEPVKDGNGWRGWIQGYGPATYHECHNADEADAKCRKQINRMIAASIEYRSLSLQ